MRRFLLIAICSIALSGVARAQTVWSMYVSGSGVNVDQFTTGSLASAFGTKPGGTWSHTGRFEANIFQFQTSGLPAGSYAFTIDGGNSTNMVAARVVNGNRIDYPVPYTYYFTWNGSNSVVLEPHGFTPPPPLVTNSFNWTFGPEWGGTILQVRATNGTTLGTWALPATIGPGGYVLSSSIVTNQSLLTGAQVFLDGQSAASLAAASTNSDLNGFADRPGYALSFGPDYQGGEWQVRRSDGSVAATGSAATFGTVSSGRVTLLPEGSTGSIWTRVPAGDGMGSVWVNSGITVSGNNVTTYNFSSAPSPTPAPTPNLPTNAPAAPITNAPAPVPTPGTNSVGPAPVSTNDVTVDVDTLTEIETDDGEQGVLDQVTSMSEKFRLVMDNFKGAFENVAFTFNEFRKFTLGGVGTNCTLNIGPVSLNLGGIVPDAVRSGMKLFILLVGVFAAIRYTWETFA